MVLRKSFYIRWSAGRSPRVHEVNPGRDPSKYAPESVLTEKFRCGQFEEGLHESIKRYLTAVTSLQAVNFYQLVQAAIKIEKSEMKSQERKKEKKFSRGGSSSGKRLRESQVDSV